MTRHEGAESNQQALVTYYKEVHGRPKLGARMRLRQTLAAVALTLVAGATVNTITGGGSADAERSGAGSVAAENYGNGNDSGSVDMGEGTVPTDMPSAETSKAAGGLACRVQRLVAEPFSGSGSRTVEVGIQLTGAEVTAASFAVPAIREGVIAPGGGGVVTTKSVDSVTVEVPGSSDASTVYGLYAQANGTEVQCDLGFTFSGPQDPEPQTVDNDQLPLSSNG